MLKSQYLDELLSHLAQSSIPGWENEVNNSVSQMTGIKASPELY